LSARARANNVMAKSFAVPADPAKRPGWVSDDKGVIWNIFCDDATSANHCVTSNCDTANDGRISANCGTNFFIKLGLNSSLRSTKARGFITLVNTHDGPQNTFSSSGMPL
jgi:hypothetical protein